MIPLAVHAFPGQETPARALAEALGSPFASVDLHRFPDGEILPTVPAPARTVVAYCSLHHPNEPLVALLLAADAWRRSGVERLVLAAPYLCYMRQDTVFAPGQPVSRDVVADLIGRRFDRLATVEAHLHRTRDLAEAFGMRAQSLSAAGPLAEAVRQGGAPALVVGPDAESAAWVERIADRLQAPWLVFRKQRFGDQAVRLQAPDLSAAAGRRVLIVDDVVSSGGTLAAAARELRAAGAASIEAAVAHALFDPEAERRLREAGVGRIVSTDSVPHPSNAAPLAPLLAQALADEVVR